MNENTPTTISAEANPVDDSWRSVPFNLAPLPAEFSYQCMEFSGAMLKASGNRSNIVVSVTQFLNLSARVVKEPSYKLLMDWRTNFEDLVKSGTNFDPAKTIKHHHYDFSNSQINNNSALIAGSLILDVAYLHVLNNLAKAALEWKRGRLPETAIGDQQVPGISKTPCPVQEAAFRAFIKAIGSDFPKARQHVEHVKGQYKYWHAALVKHNLVPPDASLTEILKDVEMIRPPRPDSESKYIHVGFDGPVPSVARPGRFGLLRG